VRGEDPDSEPRRVRPGGSGNGSVDPRNWWFAAYHSYLIHHTESGRTIFFRLGFALRANRVAAPPPRHAVAGLRPATRSAQKHG
jgi:hypothetical protein